eukprot:8551962-Karenia_brevis.AAC.1
MAGAPTIGRVHAIVKAMRDADIARLCNDDDLYRMAEAVVEKSTILSVEYPDTQCPCCSKSLSKYRQKTVTAWVLTVNGLRKYQHVPKRCFHAGCAQRYKFLWSNFVSSSKGKHEWVCP